MKIRVFPCHGDTYNSIVIDTDDLCLFSSFEHRSDPSDVLPSIFIYDLICDLIDKN